MLDEREWLQDRANGCGRSRELLRHYVPLIPRTVSALHRRAHPTPASFVEDWRTVNAPAFLASGFDCLTSLLCLTETAAKQEHDCWGLLRRLYDCALMFCWIAIDPGDHFIRWLASDFKYRLEGAKESGEPIDPDVEPFMRTLVEHARDNKKGIPLVRKLAVRVDQHWSKALGQKTHFTLLHQTYRVASALVHHAPQSLGRWIRPNEEDPSVVAIGIFKDRPFRRPAIMFAPTIIEEWMLVASRVMDDPLPPPPATPSSPTVPPASPAPTDPGPAPPPPLGG